MIAKVDTGPGYDRMHNRPDGRPKRPWPSARAARRYARQVLGVPCKQYLCWCGRYHNTEVA